MAHVTHCRHPRHRRALGGLGLVALSLLGTAHAATPEGMVWIPGGEFTMGTDETAAYEPERPAHRVRVEGFWMDTHEVTNRQFQSFVEATGYVTTAEKPVLWEDLKKQLPPGTPEPPPETLVPGSLVFVSPTAPVSLRDITARWHYVPGANWRHPEGPESNIEQRLDHPVVQVSWDDANAYAGWAKKRLPTEAEWERAARGGLEKTRYTWGDEMTPGGKWMANTWQGPFPTKNDQSDAFDRTAPTGSYPPNGFGLYDMIGNTWEWCADWYDAGLYARRAKDAPILSPKGPDAPYDPEEPYAPLRVTRGGSFLCSENYCANYRPSGRRGTAADTGASHVGFRCVTSNEAPPTP
jgi:sulfatase modifying factor 1